ncbi:MAG: hypothetical protein ACD_43C00124G0001 [uncultured bacterium]|nr:MAG: hypothetical protein ACD_43C00124G0001 [uncultured bacterium]
MSSRLRVALIEDEPSLVALYSVGLQTIGEVEAALNKGDAEVLLQRYIDQKIKPDVILLDLIIPASPNTSVNFIDRPGFELLRWIRQNDWLKTVPIIVMTNLDSTDDRLMAEELGANDYLIKSNVVPSEIVRRIRAIL